MANNKPAWLLDPVVAQVGDRFVASTPLAAGHIANALGYTRHQIRRLAKLEELFATAQEVASAQPQNTDDLQRLVEETCQRLEQLPVGGWSVVPAGWQSPNGSNFLLLLLEKTAAGSFAVVVCNAGSGLSYHPAEAARSNKMKFRLAARMENIPAVRLLSVPLWSLIYTQTLQESEHHRQEALYDVILPFLAGQLLPQAWAETRDDPAARFRTPSRGDTPHYHCVIEATRYLLARRGLSSDQLAQLQYALSRDTMQKVHEDLRVLADPVEALDDGLAWGLGEAPPRDGPGRLPDPLMSKLYNSTPVMTASLERVPSATLRQQHLLLYAGAEWCEPCNRFLPKLIAVHNALQRRGVNAHVVYLSNDRSPDQFTTYRQRMPSSWLAVDFAAGEARQELMQALGLRALPSLVVLGPEGHVYNLNAVQNVQSDPDAQAFPWSPLALAEHRAQQGPQPLPSHAAKVIRWACEAAVRRGIREHRAGRLDVAGLRALQTHTDRVAGLVHELPGGHRFISDSHERLALQDAVAPAAQYPVHALPRGDLLVLEERTAKYAGALRRPTPPQPVDMLRLPTRVTTVAEGFALIDETKRLCYLLLDRAQDSSTSSRLVLQYQVIALIGELFTKRLPLPLPPTPSSEGPHDEAASVDIWQQSVDRELQMGILEGIYRLALTYGQMWQAVDHPTRESACECSLVAGCMLVVYDAVLRQVAVDAPLVVSVLIGEQPSYKLSTTVCQDNRPFAEVATRLQLSTPHHVRARDGMLAYLAHAEATHQHPLFQLRQPEKIEVKKYGATLLFLRGMLERLGYPLIDPNNPNPPPEIEALVEWMIGENTTLAKDHPEWGMTRDMVVLFKFLATMETREMELMRGRKDKSPFAWWSLSFEESGRRGWWGSLRGTPLRWEAVGFRGMDLDTADLEVVGFGERAVRFGQGAAVQSPADVSRFLGIEGPSEEDVLHATGLPTFNNAISREESEMLMSYLTVDYVRVPMVLGFFATRDRVTYLFNPSLQALLRAVLFEGGLWVHQQDDRPIAEVPVRMTDRQRREQEARDRLNGRQTLQQQRLGTPFGLLYNELIHCPGACLDSMLGIFKATAALRQSSVYTRDATFLLYLLDMALDTEAYIVYVLADDSAPAVTSNGVELRPTLEAYLAQFRAHLRNDILPMLTRWWTEAQKAGDVNTCCVALAYRALCYGNQDLATLPLTEVQDALAAYLYVRNWHGFGLGMQVSQMHVEEAEGLRPQDRLRRFLQAYGLNTSRVKEDDLNKYIKGKPLFLNLGGVTVRAPTLADETQGHQRLPPADVPEHKLIQMQHRQRRQLCKVVQGLFDQGQLPSFMTAVLRVALRSEDFGESEWEQQDAGRYTAPRSELLVDFQTGEVLWRNDQLKPVPDSIAQMNDYQAFFHGRALHCGVVAHQKHRRWIHLVGTEYDVIEWDEPSAVDQGVGCPTAPPLEGPGDNGASATADVPPERQQAAHELVMLGFDYAQCVRALRLHQDNAEAAANWLFSGANEGDLPADFDLAHRFTRRAEASDQVGIEFADAALYLSTKYTRHFDPYSEELHCGLPATEAWVASALRPVVLFFYPAFPPDRKMKYKLLLPETPADAEATEVRLLGCVAHTEKDATWKEVVVDRHRGLVSVFNLTSHGRRLFRVQVYSSDHRFALQPLALRLNPDAAPQPQPLLHQAGNFAIKRLDEASLLLLRRNLRIGGHETYLPTRLLAGLLPAVLFESHRFWQGEDGLIRGEPLDADSSWGAYNVLVQLNDQGRTVHVRRQPLTHVPTNQRPREDALEANMLVRQTSSSQPAEAEVSFDAASVEQLTQLGFSTATAKLALRNTAFNTTRAASWLFDPANMAAISAAAAEEARGGQGQRGADGREGASVNEEHVAIILSMGFSEAAARAALRHCPEPETALAWITDDANAATIAQAEAQAASGAPEPMDDTPAASLEPVPIASEADLLLLNLLSAAPGTALHRLASVLARIEDLSHVLVWGHGPTQSHGSLTDAHLSQLTEIDCIELPRLKLRFKPEMCIDGVRRLAVLDQGGWYISDALHDEAVPGREQLRALCETLHQGLLLENASGAYMVLLPNHDVYRPPVQDLPLSEELLFDRGSERWLTAMSAKFFLYPVHGSLTYLRPTTMAASLYLALVRLLARDYVAAHELLQAVSTDTDLTAEESHIFDQFERTVPDRHPGALACRLKLYLAIMYSDNPLPSPIHDELEQYLLVRSGCPAALRLTAEEELDALTICQKMTPVLKNHLAYVQELLGRHTGALHFGVENTRCAPVKPEQVELRALKLRVGGQPWAKLNTYTLDYLTRSGTRLTRVQCQLPGRGDGRLSTKDALAIMWEDRLVADEESGSNRQLGFWFLYCLATKACQVEGFDEAAHHAYAELLTRLFACKLARWGKEAADAGEIEATPSSRMVMLASILSEMSGQTWPLPCRDDHSQRLLQVGVDLYSPQQRDTAVKAFMDELDMVYRSHMTSPTRLSLMTMQSDVFGAVRNLGLARDQKAQPHPYASTALPLLTSDTSREELTLRPVTFSGPSRATSGDDLLADLLGDSDSHADPAAPDAAKPNGYDLSAPELAAFATRPLAAVNAHEFAAERAPSNTADRAAVDLQFDISQHPTAASTVSREMIERLRNDIATYAHTYNARREQYLAGFLESDADYRNPKALAAAQARLHELVRLLRGAHGRDVATAVQLHAELEERITATGSASGEEPLLFGMEQFINVRPRVTPAFALSCVVSAQAEHDLRVGNPFVTDTEGIVALGAVYMLLVSRAAQAARVVHECMALLALLQRLALHCDGASADGSEDKDDATTALQRSVAQAQTALAENLCMRRHYMRLATDADLQASSANGGLVTFDPRFLLAEYMFEILLRARQVEIVGDMASAARAGTSKVQQAIMGSGKTWVIAPLLTLILSSPEALVVHVMPTALLEQTRNVLRARFGAVVVKRVYTLNFDRNIEDVERIGELHAKILSALRRRDIVCASPEVMKSLMLKFVEELECLERCDMDMLTPNQSLRNNREVERLRDQLANRSDIADRVASLLEILRVHGVLIMDEVDVILNPLKSELNFPIGASELMPSFRWELALHLLDAFFHRTDQRLTDYPDARSVAQKCPALDPVPDILAHLDAAVEQGIHSGHLQQEPHVVLLSSAYYAEHIRPWAARWAVVWLLHAWDFDQLPLPLPALLAYLERGSKAEAAVLTVVGGALSGEALRLLNLASEWIRTLLPHVLAKINRVGYGLLTPSDLARLDPRTPQSRRLMAVPFVGKDVPSRSSEFAHPDVLIGLTIMAYRYEGLRASDLKRMVVQLKQDLSRQVGPREQRPASVVFQGFLDASAHEPWRASWLRPALDAKDDDITEGAAINNDQDVMERFKVILPLPLFQPSDGGQMGELQQLLRHLPHPIFYYLRQHVFPSCMRSQAIKLSASGVDLGSSILFGRARLGFSGTPNNLMPQDLGRCEYEPGSDGKVMHVLTTPHVTSAEIKSDWTPKSLLRDVAASGLYHALIDTGALITGMSNESAAHFLLQHLPPTPFQGVVYLDSEDRQMILLRASGRSMPLAQCGLEPGQRFTLFDQVHTTGMDIKQFPNARAVVTIGKDMTWRDYAQGAFRMRGIGKGQTICLYIIEEVLQLVRQELGAHATQAHRLDVPAWLLINSMKMTSLQYCKLGMQEMGNVWRKRALQALTDECRAALVQQLPNGNADTAPAVDPDVRPAPGAARMRRFVGHSVEVEWRRRCVDQFRERIGVPISDTIAEPESFSSRLRALKAEQAEFAPSEAEAALIDRIINKVEQIGNTFVTQAEGGLDSECVHEAEAQAEEEAEEEAEQEQEKMSAFNRDDEQHNPWRLSLLAHVPGLKLGGEEPFYPFHDFHVREEQPRLAFPPNLLLTDNFFRPRWVGVGDRRLKNVALIMEWHPSLARDVLRRQVGLCFQALLAQGVAPNVAAARALQEATASVNATPAALQTQSSESPVYQVALSLAEGETLRRAIHSRQEVFRACGVRLYTIDGVMLDASHLLRHLAPDGAAEAAHNRAVSLACLRFINNEMFFDAEALQLLLTALSSNPVPSRVKFFEECQRLRRRERNRWADTPLAKVLTEEAQWHLLDARAKLEQLNTSLRARPAIDLLAAFRRHAQRAESGAALPRADLQRCLESLQLGFSPRDLAELVALVVRPDAEMLSETELREHFFTREPEAESMETESSEDEVWLCQNCTFVNPMTERSCAMCELGWTGERTCPSNKWTCLTCTFFNPNSLFYCDVCGKVRPDLASVRF
ncbi:uncharacterized protein MONBRDRAFT_31645 [Monosiga brevicollis MX1]|uniref:ubiquitinyl hydrolase 1 n=1 Tax=Monosiga brevicollis TaxID=81824 RepID=A9UUW8_MONBE|nr:uncharacterized protein MONBRDRAFT_31645 [Monosiga brevicollis MX1]EDQ90981.1 predicted protein [Monosiga brevicollis MX1]|eukprot:XP_001744278.1 hypothetical protein [Monosiga brevicollis MX1]